MLDEERVVVTLRQLLLADRALVVGFDARHDALLVKDVMQSMFVFLDVYHRVVRLNFAKFVMLIVSGQRKEQVVMILMEKGLFVRNVWNNIYSSGKLMMQHYK